MSSEAEHELIAKAKNDPEAFGDLYNKYVERIYNYHYRHTSNSTEAEDLTSRTFYRALRSLHRYRETGASFQAWLFRIAHNLVVNWYRDNKDHHHVSIDVDHPVTLRATSLSPESRLTQTETQQALLTVIDDLAEDRKTLIILKFVERMTNAEIGEVLGRSEGAIKALYHRTLIDLRKSMKEGISDVQEI